MPCMKEVFEKQQIRDFDQAMKGTLAPGFPPEYTVEPRAVGITVLLVYDKGTLSEATTLDHHYGRVDITPNAKTILAVPLTIVAALGRNAPPDRLETWGIIYMAKDASTGKPPLRLLRDAAASSLIGVDIRITARRPLDFFCCGAQREPQIGRSFGVQSHYEIMLLLQDWGFRVNRPHIKRCRDISALIRNIDLIKEKREQYPFDVDGAIIQVNQRTEIGQRESGTDCPIIAYGFGPE